MTALLVIHAALTWFMVGLIWVIQTVHYPLFPAVGRDHFPAYETGHTRRMGALLAVPAFGEVATAAVLPFALADGVPLWLVLASGVLLAATWIMTATVQVPLHRRLSRDPGEPDMRRLVATNWWRTGLWTVRGVLVATALVLAV